MLLSVQQKYILDVLRKLGCVRRRQLDTLVREKFRRFDLEITESRIPFEDCHFGYFDLERLQAAYRILLKIHGQEMRYDSCGNIHFDKS